jgi:hypothetical protein
MTGTLRRIKPPRTPEEFVEQAKTNLTADQPQEEPAAAPQPPPVPAPPPTQRQKPAAPANGLNPRVLKQVNLKMPETDHFELMALVHTLPSMSMHRFILEAIAEKMERVRAGG